VALHSYVQNYIHLIWVVKDRFPILNNNLKIKLFKHLENSIFKMKVVKIELNIQPEHVHLLASIPSDLSISEFIKNIKGESSHWINQNDFLKVKFSWQRGYGAFSVSASQLDSVKKYIQDQDDHHTKTLFTEEYKAWVKKYKLKYIDK